MTAADVITGSARWSCEKADAIEWLRTLPDDSVDLLFTSPPYENCRTYGLDGKLPVGQEWVSWMVEVFRAAAPKVKGLIAMNCEGQTRGYRYSCVPFLLMADLHRAGFNLRKPPVFHRVGIPGSGGPDWLRNDYEPVVCVTREGKLPWSDNTACGHPPKWAPGGAMSNRYKDGQRKNESNGPKWKDRTLGRNQWGETVTPAKLGEKNKHGVKAKRLKPSHVFDGSVEAIANPGNVVALKVGGGVMGHPTAHDNEAPFPVELPAFFAKSFCPPDGVVADCFSGSGSTAQAALERGAKFIGCDIRQSQVELCERRMRTVTPAMFS